MHRFIASHPLNCRFQIQSRLMRMIVVLLSLLAWFPSIAGDEFIISYWWGPPATADLDQRYAEIAACNFTHAGFPGGSATTAQNLAILDACQRHGLKFIVNDSRILKFTPEQPQFAQNLGAIVADYSKHPALAAYHVADEPGADAFRVLGAVNRHLMQADPQHLPWINLLPNFVPDSLLGSTYEQHVERYLTEVKPRLLCFDHYALMNDSSVHAMYFENFEIIRRQGLKHGVPFGFIFLATPHGAFRDPNEIELRWQVFAGLAYGARAMFYFTYWTPAPDGANTFRNGIIEQDGTRTKHYDMAKGINADVKAWAPTLMKLTSTGVYHTGVVPTGCQKLSDAAGLEIKGDASLVIGTFRHVDGTRWAMVVNRDFKQVASAKLRPIESANAIEELKPADGRLVPAEMEANGVPLLLPPGGARLLRFVK
jgi:hypothetical protein